MRDDIRNAVREHVKVPPHIGAIAGAIAYDLMHGPSFLVLPQGDVTKFHGDCVATYYEDAEGMAEPGDVIEETYVGKAANALRTFIRDELPGTLYVDTDCGNVSESEPEGFEDEETGEYVEPYMGATYLLGAREVVEAVFGRTIAREFDF